MDKNLSVTILELIELIKKKKLQNTNKAIFKKALEEREDNLNILIEIGIQCAQIKNLNEALFIFEGLINFIKTDVRIYYNLGIIYSMCKEHQLALDAYNSVLNFHPNDIETLINKGSTLNDLGRYEDAVKILKTAIELDPNYPEAWSNLGIALNNIFNYKDSIEAYSKAIQLNKFYPEAWSNKSIPLIKLGYLDDAIEACDTAINLKKDYAEPWSNKGNALYELRRYEEALAHYDRALSLNPNYAEGWSNKGNALHELKRYEEALFNYQKALALDKTIDFLLGNYLLLKIQVGEWTNLEKIITEINDGIKKNISVITPFAALALFDNEMIHFIAAQKYAKEKLPNNPILGQIKPRIRKPKIKIAYFSGDYREHAVAYLTAELFETHDRSKFEIIGFAWDINFNDLMTQRIKASFDHFIDISSKSDIEIVKIARDLEIDIAVDLMGYTENSRTNIFSYQVAPIQCSYIGYLGSMGADYYDYIIGDKTVIPSENRKFFNEKIVYLPCFQCNDSKRQISPKIISRRNYGISEEAFVFCCFNSSYKIQPKFFQTWMEILKSVENSVLWLIEGNRLFKKNLLMEAKKFGIDQDRILFAPQSSRQEYLQRYLIVDLFLDTLPYNAGTTASDALWCGVPVLTQLGDAYPGRMAASLLKNLDLQELIVNSSSTYKKLAIELANHPSKLRNIKTKLFHERTNSKTFNIGYFSNNLELAYTKMYEFYDSNLEFQDIEIPYSA